MASPVYIKTQILESGYYMPGILKRLKSLQDKCPVCRKHVQKKLDSVMGAVGRNRLTYSTPFSGMQADLVGKALKNEGITIIKRSPIVLIIDLLTKLSYPKLGRIAKVEKDTMGTERYYQVEYKKNKRVFATVKRTAQSFYIVMKKDEQEGQVIDPILFLDEADLAPASKKQRVIVKLAEKENAILDIGSAKGTQ